DRSKRQQRSWTRRPRPWACPSPGCAAASGHYWRNVMPDLRTRFQPADRIAAPDLWPDVLTREPGEPPPRSPWGRVTTLAMAVGVAALAILVLIRVLPLGSAKPVAPSPTPTTPSPSSGPSPARSAGPAVGMIHS